MPDEIPAIVNAIEAYVAAGPNSRTTIDDVDLIRIAASKRLLPAVNDMGGFYAIRSNGEVVSILWDEPDSLRVELEQRVCEMVYYQAFLKFPQLESLIPQRPDDAMVCDLCDGTGKEKGIAERHVHAVICSCGGLGWIRAEDPALHGRSMIRRAFSKLRNWFRSQLHF